ncbi:hypothetical protein ACFV3O_07860, partial [Streptomyces albidoflavus]
LEHPPPPTAPAPAGPHPRGARPRAERLSRAREETLAELLGDWWGPERPTDLAEIVHRLSTELCGSDGERPHDGGAGGKP